MQQILVLLSISFLTAYFETWTQYIENNWCTHLTLIELASIGHNFLANWLLKKKKKEKK